MNDKDINTTNLSENSTVKETAGANQVVASTSSIRQIDKTFNELHAIQTTVKKFKPSDLMIPLLSIFMLALLTVFVYIPMITSGMKYRDQTKEVKANVEKLTKLESDLDNMDLANLQTDLSNSRSVIPFSLQVSNFLSYLNDSAVQNGLSVKALLAGDVAVSSSSGSKGLDTVMKGVSGPVKYTGSLSSILRFLSELQEASPYLVSADQINLSSSSNNWELSLSITGFYLNQSALPQVSIYEPFQPYTTYSDVLGTFKQKADKLQSGN